MVKSLTDYCHIINRDVRFVLRGRRALKKVEKYISQDITIGDALDKTASRYPEKTALIHEDAQWTFRQVQDFSFKIGNLFGSWLDKGDVVVLLMPSCPEFAGTWLGLSRIGVISAFVNYNLFRKPLLHCINVAKPKVIIYSKQFDSQLLEIMDSLENDPKFYCLEGGSDLPSSIDLTSLLEKVDGGRITLRREVTFRDLIIFIYTSGTTGLPKPAKITQSKLFGLTLTGELIVGLQHGDVIYSPMPQYHTAATTVMAACFVMGYTIVLKSKFSASTFIDDCIKYKATVAQYIGEMIRYVVKTEEKPGERNHSLRMISGNGLTGDVWTKFVQRFGDIRIVEYYGSTEGNFILANSNAVGACGYLPIGLPRYYMLGPSLIKVDDDTGLPIRNADGLCILAEPGEQALCIGYCPAGNEMRKFQGYLNEKDSELKRIRDVFVKGDVAFNTGDLMVMDARGYVTFVDRMGDTFRWKGENVSTAEVESIINSFSFVRDAAVYGVQVGNVEGRCGMVSLIMDLADLDKLAQELDLSLPPYARPLFVRIVSDLQYTATYKVIKVQLKKDAFDISRITDPLFFRMKNEFTPLTDDIYHNILDGSLKL